MQNSLRSFTFILLVLIALVPAVNIFPWLAPAAWGQAVLVRIFVPLLIFLFLARLFSEPELVKQALWRLQSAKLPLIFFGLFFILSILATIFSKDPHFSLWGDPDRAWGMVNYTLYALFGLVAFLSLHKEEWKTLWLWVFGLAIFLSLIAFAQRFALAPDMINPTNRPFATLGNAILLGVYLAPLFFLFLVSRVKEASAAKRRLLEVGMVLMLFAIIFTASRSALLALGAGTLFLLLFSPVRTKVLRRIGLGFLLAGIAGALILFFNPTAPPLLGENTQASYLYKRITPQNILGSERFAGWAIELKGIADSPLLGYGPYNSAIGFNRHFQTEFSTKYSSTGWWDTAHSMYLDIAAGTGFLGLAAFILFLGALLWRLARARKTNSPQEKLVVHGAQTALIVFLAGMISAFTATALYILLFLLCAYALFLTTPTFSLRTTMPFSLRLPHIFQRSALAAFAIFMIFFLYTGAIKPLVVNKAINVAQAKAGQGQCQEALDILDSSFPANSHFEEYHTQRHVDVIGKCLSKLPSQVKELSQNAADMLQEYHKTRAFDPRSHILLGSYLNNLMIVSESDEERAYLGQQAETAFARAQGLSPDRVEIFAKRAQTYRLTGQNKKWQADVDTCLALRPDLNSCWQERILGYAQYEGTLPHYSELNKEARERGIDLQYEPFLFQLAQAYHEKEELYKKDLIIVYEKLVGFGPDNFQYHTTLARLYQDTGEQDKVIYELRQMWRIRPTPETQQEINMFLQALPPIDYMAN